MNINWGWLGAHTRLFWDLTQQHVYLSLVPIIIGTVAALLLGLAAVQWTWLHTPLLIATSVFYAIPSIALFVVLLDFTGLSSATAIIPLSLFSLSVLYRNVVGGLQSVDPATQQAASAMGFGRARRLLQVDLPIATPVILSGIRIAAVANVSMVSIAALIGLGGLGQLFTEGLQRFFMTEILAGIVLIMVVAFAIDGLLVLTQRRLTPWAQR